VERVRIRATLAVEEQGQSRLVLMFPAEGVGLVGQSLELLLSSNRPFVFLRSSMTVPTAVFFHEPT